jgi:hypothetical protein
MICASEVHLYVSWDPLLVKFYCHTSAWVLSNVVYLLAVYNESTQVHGDNPNFKARAP